MRASCVSALKDDNSASVKSPCFFQVLKTEVESLHIDPRYYQLVVQITLLLFGILQLQFEISPMRIAAVVAVAWLLQLFLLASIS